MGERGEIVGGLGNSIGGIRRLTRREKEDEEEGKDLKRMMSVRRGRERWTERNEMRKLGGRRGEEEERRA